MFSQLLTNEHAYSHTNTQKNTMHMKVHERVSTQMPLTLQQMPWVGLLETAMAAAHAAAGEAGAQHAKEKGPKQRRQARPPLLAQPSSQLPWGGQKLVNLHRYSEINSVDHLQVTVLFCL
jgi:hypothetical protein